ncbi:unnamed protein product, partial [Didymodactylos carnosus]
MNFFAFSLILLVFNTIPTNGLECYKCYCADSAACPCNETESRQGNNTYCVITREHIGGNFDISLGHIGTNSTKVYIKNPHYISVRESVKYNDNTSEWETIPDLIAYGCNWDYCNKPELVPLLPGSLSLSLPNAWLDTFILGTNPSTCHECRDGPVCGDTDFFDISRCPEKACNATCILSDLFDNPDTNPLQFCYQSFCYGDESTSDLDIDTHRIQVDGIYYLDTRKFDIWEIDIFCRADDCSRPEIFNEIRSNLTTQINVNAFLSLRPDGLWCYSCDQCIDTTTCPCIDVEFKEGKDSYCIIE